jgi:hypothetical protein
MSLREVEFFARSLIQLNCPEKEPLAYAKVLYGDFIYSPVALPVA